MKGTEVISSHVDKGSAEIKQKYIHFALSRFK